METHTKKNIAHDVMLLKCCNYSEEYIKKAMEKMLTSLDVKFDENTIIKPNLCLPVAYSKHLTTHPEVIKQIISAAQRSQVKEISLADTPVGKSDFARREELWKKTGMQKLILEHGVKRNDLDGKLILRESLIEGKKVTYPISSDVFNSYLVNAPKFKTHGFMLFTGAVKNLYGVLPEYTKKRIHRELENKDDFAQFLVELANEINPSFNVMDAVIGIEGEGPGAKGRRRYIGALIASKNVFALDYVAALLMGIDPCDVPTIQISIDKGYIDPKQINIMGESINKFILEDYQLPIINKKTDRITSKLFHLSRYTLTIDNEKCTGCGICQKNCPHMAIEYKNSMVIDKKLCKSCLVCHEICPFGAISFETYSFLKELSRKEADARKKREQKWIFVLGNPESEGVVLRIKKMGYLVALIHDKTLKIRPEVCDFHCTQITKTDLLNYNIKGVINYHSEANVVRYSQFCEYLNINSIPLSSAEIMTDKLKLRLTLSQCGIKMPHFTSSMDANNLVLDKEKSYVVKPLDCSNSRGVYLIQGNNICNEIIQKSLSCSKKQNVIIEEFISGTEYDVTCVVWDNELIDIYVNKRLRCESENEFGTVIGFQTVELKKNELDDLQKLCTLSIKKLNINRGIISFQLIYSNNEWYLIEMAGRAMGGGLVEFLYAVNNINIDELLINISLGNNIHALLNKRRCRHGAFLFASKFVECKNSKGFELSEVRKSKGVLWANIGKAGDTVTGGIFCYGRNDDEALQNALDAMKLVSYT